MTEIEKMWAYIGTTPPIKSDRYGLECTAFFELVDCVQSERLSFAKAVHLAFTYGRAKGYRAAKAEAGRNKREAVS